MIAREDEELLPWIGGIIDGQPHGSGSFLFSLAEAALRADSDNYGLLRPALVAIREKYPRYHAPLWKPLSAGESSSAT